MNTSESFEPTEAHLGKDCRYWDLSGPFKGCSYPKAEMEGRTSCEGIIDDVCLFLRIGRRPSSITDEQIEEIKTRVPTFRSNRRLPPGDIK